MRPEVSYLAGKMRSRMVKWRCDWDVNTTEAFALDEKGVWLQFPRDFLCSVVKFLRLRSKTGRCFWV